MKRYHLIQLVTLAFFIGVISGILIYHKWNYLPWKEILLAIPTLLAAFMGAWFAFKLEDNRRREEQKKKNISACNKNIYILSKQYDVLLELQIKIIEPVRNSLEHYFVKNLSGAFFLKAFRFNFKIAIGKFFVL